MSARPIPTDCATCLACGHGLALLDTPPDVTASVICRHDLVCVNCGRHHRLTLSLRFLTVDEALIYHQESEPCRKTA